MNIRVSLIFIGLTLFTVNVLFAQAPTISYASSPVSLLSGTAVGTAPNPTVNITSSGGTVGSTFAYGAATQPLSGGSFSSPARGAVDASGNIYIVNYGNNTISKFTSAGVLVTNNYTSGGTLSSPAGIVFDSSGNMFILNSGATLLKYNSSGVFVSTTTITSGGTTTGLAIDASNNMYVTSTNGTTYKIFKVVPALTFSALITTNLNDPSAIDVDAAGNIYVLNKGNGNIGVFNSAGTSQTTTFATGYTGSYGLSVDQVNGYVYIANLTANTIKVYNTGTAASATVLYTITSTTNCYGVFPDFKGNIYASDFTNNKVYIYKPTGQYFIDKILPTGLSISKTTGAITGTATLSTAAANYNVYAYNATGSGSTTLNLTVYSKVAWTGASTTWTTGSNWSTGNVPNSWDQVTIGSTTAYTNLPTITTTVNVASITMGTSDNNTAPSITVTSPGILNVTNDITYQSDASSLTNNGFTATLAGTGTINAVNLNIVANTVLNSYTLKLTSSITSLNLSGDVNLTSTYTSGTQIDNATFTISGGTVTVTNFNTTNGANASSTSTLAMTGGTLNFTDPTPLGNLSSTGTNTLTLTAGTIGYTASGAQTIYTSTPITGLPSGISYQGLTLSGSGIKTAASGNLNIAGSFTNSLANDASNYLDASGAAVIFTGTTQTLAGGSGNGTDFKNVTIGGSGTKTIASGKVNIISTGTLTLSGGSLATGGFLTLRSDANGSASVAAISSGSITGNANVERYLTGGFSYSRGWRLLSSPVAASSISAITPNLTYVHTKAYTTGSTGTTGGFDATGNPTFYFYRENMAPNFTSFITGNFRGVNKISTSGTPVSTFSFDGGDADATLPVGNGFLFFFRGDRSNPTPTVTTSTAPATTLTATGYLNQGNITVNPWFPNPFGASKLSFTAATPTSVQGFNLVGNPYASSINWDAVGGITKTNITNTIYIYNPKLKVYATYVGGNSGNGTGFNSAGTANIIPSGQGFFVKATANTAALTFTETSKVSTQVSSSNLLLAGTNPSPQTYLRLVLLLDSLNKEDALIFFKPTASPNYVSDEDADYFIGESIVHISSRSPDNHNLAINQMPFSLTRQQIPLNVTVNKSGTYTLDISEAINIPSRYKIYLADAYKKDSVDIKKQPVYTFTADTTNASTFGSSRFYLVINQNDSSAYKLTDLVAVKSVSGVSVIWKTVNESTNLTFTIERSNDGGLTYSLLGSMGSSGLGTYSFVDKSPQAGVNIYRLKQQDNFGGLTYTEGSINYSAAGSTNSVGVYPNPATATIKLAVTEISKTIADNTLPDYTIAISNNTGSIVKSIITSKPGSWQGDVSKYAPGMYFLRVINNNTKTVVGSSKFIKL